MARKISDTTAQKNNERATDWNKEHKDRKNKNNAEYRKRKANELTLLMSKVTELEERIKKLEDK